MARIDLASSILPAAGWRMSVHPSSLSDSLRSDQRQRWSRGERVLVESYLASHPNLASNHAVLLDLIEEEFRLRAEFGETPSLEEYVQRFPALGGTVRARLETMPPKRFTAIRDTDRARPSGLRTLQLCCPYCEGNVPLVESEQPTHLRCPRCDRKIRVIEETISHRVKLGRTIANFALIRRVGSGQFGEVWLARDNKLRRDVALKLPRGWEQSKTTLDLFFREARAAAKLRHANIVPVYDAGAEGEQPYIVSAFVPGTNLKDLLVHKRFTPAEAARLCQAIAEAVHHAHQAGIVHRDLKPSNVLIDLDGVPYVTDFGLAKHASLEEATITEQGQMLGTPAYMSPEQARGTAAIGPTSDVFSLGVLLYELLAGQRPFDGNLEVLIYRILTEDPVPPRKLNPALSPDLETICLKALSKAPTDRYTTAQDLADDLGRFLRGEVIHAKPAGWLKRAWRRMQRTPRAVAAALVLCILLGVGAGFMARGTPAEPEIREVPGPPVDVPAPPDERYTHKVLIATEPPGANVICYPLDFWTGRPQFEKGIEAGPSPAHVELMNGTYLVVVWTDDAFHEVFRTVPRIPGSDSGTLPHEKHEWNKETETVEWKEIKLFPYRLPAEKLARITGSDEFNVDHTAIGGSKERFAVPTFDVELTEVSIANYRRLQSYLYPGIPGDWPATHLKWGSAVAYAEARGLRLPEFIEWQFAATARGTQRYSWGNADPPADNWRFNRPVSESHDKLTLDPRIIGLCSGVLEWTTTRMADGPVDGAGFRFLATGPAYLLDDPELSDHIVPAGGVAFVNEFGRHEGLGMRCVRSIAPRREAHDFVRPFGAD